MHTKTGIQHRPHDEASVKTPSSMEDAFPAPGRESPSEIAVLVCRSAARVPVWKRAPDTPTADMEREDRYAAHMTDDSAALLPRVAQGDPQAVGACLERYGALVWSLARSVSSDLSLVEDTVQEIFIDVWKSAERYDPERASEVTFIAMIARRRVIDRRRRIDRTPPSDPIEGLEVGALDRQLEGIDTADEARVASEALDGLKPDQRRVIRMAVVQGLTHVEISKTTGLPLGTVKSHVRRGLSQVAEDLRRKRKEESSS